MNPEVQKKEPNLKARKAVIISLITFILLMLAVSAQFAYMILQEQNIYKGVYVNGISVGNLTSTELSAILNKSFADKIKDDVIALKTASATETVKLADIDTTYDISGIIDKAYSIGRSGNIFERLYEIAITASNGAHLEIPVTFNKGKVDNAINSLYNKVFVSVKEADLLIQQDKVVIRSGHHGESFDKEKTFNDFDVLIKKCQGGEIDIPVIKTAQSKINIEDYYAKINQDVKDATIKIENNVVSVIPHVVGRSIDKAALMSLSPEIEKTENTEKILPVIFTQPKITSEVAYASLFKDTLATTYTQFYTGTTNDSNRGSNIRIAVSKIDGKILAPGDTFSFNDIVGPRTEEGGYKIAHTYVGGKVIDGIGGGICQVSTTLYNALLFSDLEVVERTNHYFTVGYVPLGRDAAVSYNDVDLKFKNSTKWPIKITGWVTKGNQIYFSILGMNETPGKTVEIYHNMIKKVDFKEKIVDDPALLEGITEVKNEGMTGFTIDTYKIIKIDKKVVSENKIHTSVYNPLDKEIHKGVKKSPTAPPLKVEPPKPGVDDAGNPPAKPL